MPVPQISPDVSSGPNRQSLAAFNEWFNAASEYLESNGAASIDDMRTAYESGWNTGRASLDLETFPDAQGGRIDAELTALRLHDGAGLLRQAVRKLAGSSLAIRIADWLCKQGLAGASLRKEAAIPVVSLRVSGGEPNHDYAVAVPVVAPESVVEINLNTPVEIARTAGNSLGGGTDAGIPNGAQACGADSGNFSSILNRSN